MKIVIVIPARNEAKHIKKLMQSLVKFKLDIVLIDDGSSDETSKLTSKYTPYILSHSINLGKGSSLKTGCDFAFSYLKADAVIVMDSDGQHSPSEIPMFCKQLEDGNTLVLGVREPRNEMPFSKQVMNKLLSAIVGSLYGVYIPDIPSGYKAFTKKIYKHICWAGNGYEVEIQIAIKIAQLNLKFKCVSIRTIYHDYTIGMTWLDIITSFVKIFLSKLYQY